MELSKVRRFVANAQGFGKFYGKLLADGRKKHVCEGCNRGLSDAELVEFEKFVSRAPMRGGRTGLMRLGVAVQESAGARAGEAQGRDGGAPWVGSPAR